MLWTKRSDLIYLGVIGLGVLSLLLVLLGFKNHEYFNGAAALASASALLYSISYNIARDEKAKQLALLEIARSSLQEAVELCSQETINRGRWLQAARLSANARIALKDVDRTELFFAKRLTRAEYREKFRKILGFDDYDRRGSYFYGGLNSVNIEDAARAASEDFQIYRGHDFSFTARTATKIISEQSLLEIYYWTTFESFDETMDISKKFQDDDVENIMHQAPALYEYLRFIRTHIVGGGEVRRQEDG